ncbi:uncharacterized protein LOC130704202 [Daphnia carinata]|uniref:uncharacterized protein LOC130704202 n=1 Tax=Daphnia carinata TaxID=120202 RepID=UPI00257A5E6F|nr:uncharacterized protein LOC130704202 [Daphnia carinata]
MNSSIREAAAGMFKKLQEMTHSLGLPSLEFRDSFGDMEQMEIRPPTTFDYKVPNREYRTHLMRLLVNKGLSFFLEVLGQTVTSGNFLPEKSADPHLIEDVLSSLNGGVAVCQGRGNVRLDLTEPSRRKEAVRQGLIEDNMITYPDFRYRSYDCEYLVDTANGATQCPPCAQPNDSSQNEIIPNMLNLSDLKLDNNQSSKNGQIDDELEPTVIEHHHHHHHHYYRDGSSPISFLYQDPNAPAPLSLTFE